MSAPIPLRQDFDAPQLRGLARRSKDGPQARRLLALAAIYDGATRNEAARASGFRSSGTGCCASTLAGLTLW
jgi:putative transposase